ncbi:MAG TPA: hypothetical protein QF564_32995 [Pirellulaceae bacterium]|nr:hypothetical protein [Pirellulaceae bacterium]
MKRAVIALTLTTVAFGMLAVDTHAAGPLRRWMAYRRPTAQPTVNARQGLFHALPYARYESVEDAYPRYIGAFHSRYFNDLGVPPGDVGLRTNGVYMTPW